MRVIDALITMCKFVVAAFLAASLKPLDGYWQDRNPSARSGFPPSSCHLPNPIIQTLAPFLHREELSAIDNVQKGSLVSKILDRPLHVLRKRRARLGPLGCINL